MINLGTEIKDGIESAYPTMGKRDSKISYRSICVPLAILEGKEVKIGDKIIVEVSGIVTGIQQSEYCNDLTVEIHEGEIESESEESAEPDEKKITLLGG